VYLRPVDRVAVLAAALCISFAAPALAQIATRDARLAEAVQVEPEDDPCLSEAVVRARVGKRLARDAELSNVEVIVHAGDPPRLTVLRAGQRVAERRFEDFPTRCSARRDAIAVAVALALERAPEAAPSTAAGPAGETGSTPSEAAPTANEASPAPTARPAAAQGAGTRAGAEPRPDEAAVTSGSSLRLGAHAGATAMLEILPGAALAGVLGADVALPIGVRLSLSAIASLPQEDEALGATVESQLLLGRLLGCTDLTASQLAVEGCGGALAGAALAEGLGYASTRRTELAYAGIVARVALRYPAESLLSVRLSLDGLLPLVRPSYAVREQPGPGLATVTPAPVGAGLSLEIVLALP